MALRDVFGIIIILAFAAVVLALFVFTIPEENKDIVNFMLGQLSALAGAVIGYHYTKSKGDEDKTTNTGKAFDAIQAVANKPALVVDPGAVGDTSGAS